MDAAVSLSLVIAVRKTFAQTTEQDSLCLPETILKCTLSYDLTLKKKLLKKIRSPFDLHKVPLPTG